MRPLNPLLLALSLSLPTNILSAPTATPPPGLPLIIWHGLGDNFANPSLASLASTYTALYPSAPVHIITLSPTPSLDRQATFLGHLPTQLTHVCATLLALPPPFSTSRWNLLGLSQGGQFLRALLQTCPLPYPPATLLTFGAQHNGISAFLPNCAGGDWTCKSTAALLARGKWSPWAQAHLVPAQYFRDPADLPAYLAHSAFLADVNAERTRGNATFRARIARLNKMVLYVFDDDKTVVPKESGWFGEVDPVGGGVRGVRDTEGYRGDWIGLRTLDERGGLVLESCPGEHMRLGEEVVERAFRKYFAPPPPGEGVGEEEGMGSTGGREGEEEL